MPMSDEEFVQGLAGSDLQTAGRMLWNFLQEHPQYADRFRSAYEQQALDPNADIEWKAVTQELYVLVNDANDLALQNLLASNSDNWATIVPYIAGGWMMSTGHTTSDRSA